MERLKKYLCLIMCVCAILTLFGCAGASTDTTQPGTETLQKDAVREWTPIYYKHKHGMFVNYAWPSRSYQEDLNQEQIASILPEKMPEDVTCSGWVRYLDDGTAYMVALSVVRQDQAVSVYINDTNRMFSCCVSLEPNAEISVCGDLEYRIYHIDAGEKSQGMIAETKINDIPVRVTNQTDNFEGEKPYFEAVLQWLSEYGSKELDLSLLKPQAEHIDESISVNVAMTDPVFGKLMIDTPPLTFFTLEGCSRYKDYYTDNICATWSWYEDRLEWRVSVFTEEDDLRVVSVDKKQYYDLSYYSYPLYQTVPEEYVEIAVDPVFEANEVTLDVVRARKYYVPYDDGSELIRFGVKFGDLLLHIDATNIDPEWIYEQIVQIRDNLK